MLFVLSFPPAAPRLLCGCRRRCTGFPPTHPGLDSPQVVGILLTSPKFSAIAWADVALFRSLDMRIYFAIPPNKDFYFLLEEFCFSISEIRIV